MGKAALERGILENNACKNVFLPDAEQKKVKYLNNDETVYFIESLNHVPREEYNCKVALLYALFTSLRKGELFGLEERDIDFESGYITVCRARYTKTGGGTYVKRVKSKCSNREVAIPMQLMTETKTLILVNKERQFAMGRKWRESPSLFKGAFGDPMYPNMLYVWLDRFLKKNDFTSFLRQLSNNEEGTFKFQRSVGGA